MNGSAYWYKHGKLIEVQKTHINDIIENPETFGFTKKYIEDMYKKYNEKLYTEGKAREEIMVEAMKEGWIRVRQTSSRGGNRWTIQFENYKKQKKDLKNLVEHFLLDTKQMKEYDDLYLLSYDGNTNEHYNSFYGKDIQTFLESLNKEEKIIIEQIEKYIYFNY